MEWESFHLGGSRDPFFLPAGSGGSRPGGSQWGCPGQSCGQRVTLVLGRGAAEKWRCELPCLQEGQLPWCLGSSQNASSCPCSAQSLHSLSTCAPALTFPRQALHSRGGLGILEMPPGEARAGRRPCRYLEGEKKGSLTYLEGEKRGSLTPALGSWRAQGPIRAPRNDISGEEVGSQRAAPPIRAPFHGLVTPTMCLTLDTGTLQREAVPNGVEFIATSGRHRQ